MRGVYIKMLSVEFFFHFLLSSRAGSLVRTISRLSILGIALSVGALIVVVSIMNGFNDSIRQRLLKVEPHLVLEFPRHRSVSSIEKDPIYQNLSSMTGVKTYISSQQDVILRSAEGFVQGVVAKGISKKRFLSIMDFSQDEDSEIHEVRRQKIKNLKPGEVIIGLDLADSMGLFRGDSVVVIPPENLLRPSGEIPQVSQVQIGEFIATDVERVDQNTLYYIRGNSLARLQNSITRRLSVEAWLKNPEEAGRIKRSLGEKGLQIETWEERNASLFFALRLERTVVTLLVGLSALIAGFSVISVMVLLTTEKKKDIGNLLAMGMKKTEVKNLFVQVGVFLSLCGVVLGLILGLSFVGILGQFSTDVLPSFYAETDIPTDVDWIQVLCIFFISLVFSFVTLSFVMRKLSQMTPREALKI